MGSILLKLLNRLLDVAVLLTLLVTALYCVYCIWDNNTIYDAPLKLQQELRKQRPKEESPSFEELQRLNPDVAAWLTLEGTGIDDPIVQGEDNLEYLKQKCVRGICPGRKHFSGFQVRQNILGRISAGVWTSYGKAQDVWGSGPVSGRGLCGRAYHGNTDGSGKNVSAYVSGGYEGGRSGLLHL